MGRMRVTQHNGRVRKGGTPYSPKHNDRNIDLDRASNIDPARTPLNRYWAIGSKRWYSHGEAGKPSFDAVERDFYERHFTPMYEASKERSRKRGQLKRVKPFEEWRKARQFVPEETSLQIGSVSDGTVDVAVFLSCAGDYIKALNEWNKAHKKPFTMLDGAFHFDEEIPHLQIRKVWHSVDPQTGIDEIGQEKALERAGVALPDPSKPVGKDNNRKMTFDREMREKWLEICEKHGLDIEKVPEPGRKHNQTKEEYITDKQKAQAAKLAEREKAVAAMEKDAQDVKAQAVKVAQKALEDAHEIQRIRDGLQADAVNWERGIQMAKQEKAGLEREIGNMKEYKVWKAAKAAQEAQEAARRKQEEAEAKRAAEAAKKAQEAQERERREQEARKAAQAAQEAEKRRQKVANGLMTPEELYQEAMARMNGGTPSPAAPEPPRRKSSAMNDLRRKVEAARDGKQDGSDGPEGP